MSFPVDFLPVLSFISDQKYKHAPPLFTGGRHAAEQPHHLFACGWGVLDVVQQIKSLHLPRGFSLAVEGRFMFEVISVAQCE